MNQTRVLLGCAALVLMVCVAGCYSRVVGARGFGADQTSIQQGNLRNDSSGSTLGYRTIENKPIPVKSSGSSTAR